MKKIVILSDNSDRSFSWVMLLSVLFPECEIEIRTVSPEDEVLESYPFGFFTKGSITDELAR